jgi:hypothetical protein
MINKVWRGNSWPLAHPKRVFPWGNLPSISRPCGVINHPAVSMPQDSRSSVATCLNSIRAANPRTGKGARAIHRTIGGSIFPHTSTSAGQSGRQRHSGVLLALLIGLTRICLARHFLLHAGIELGMSHRNALVSAALVQLLRECFGFGIAELLNWRRLTASEQYARRK